MTLPTRRTAILAVPLLALSLAAPAGGANPPKYPCANKQTTLAILMCLDGQLRSLDAQVSAISSRIVRLYQGTPGGVADFDAAQRAWRAFAKADCVSQSVMYTGGTLQPVAEEQCLVLDTRARLAQLKTQRYGLEHG